MSRLPAPEQLADAEADGPQYQPPAAEADEGVQNSLFGEILDWMLAPLLLLWPMSIAITYLVAKSIANQPFDHALEDSVTVLAQQVRSVDGKIIKSLSGSARDILRADDVDNVYFQIHGPCLMMVAPPPAPRRVSARTRASSSDSANGLAM